MENKKSIILGFEEFQKEFRSSDLNADNEKISGNFGTVYEIENQKNEKLFAVKKMLQYESGKKENEILLRFLETNYQHKNIL